MVVLLLLKTGPSAKSSSFEGTITTPMPLIRGAGEVLTTVKGVAVIGKGEVGVGVA